MRHTIKAQGKRVGFAFVAVGAMTVLGAGAAQAQTFERADIALDNAGNLQCRFLETGLGAQSLISYSCGAEAVGVISGCFAKNKFVGPTSLAVFKNVSNQGEEGEGATLLANNNGSVRSTITVDVPESHGGEVCTEPAEARPIAVRWCNASLVDITNNVIGATAGDLLELVARTGTVVPDIPTCAELLAAPPTHGGGE